MALTNLSKDKLLAIEDLSDSYSTLFKKDMVLTNLLGKNLSVINIHVYIFIASIFSGLSVLELCLVISICHHSEIYDNEPFNFEMIFARYCKFASCNSTLLITKRQVVLKAFERLFVSFILFL